MQFVRLLHALQGVPRKKTIPGTFLVDDRQIFVVDDQNRYVEIINTNSQQNNSSP